MVGWACAQKNFNEKVLPQIEKMVVSKLEATMTKQLKFQFQTSGKQSLQVRLSCFAITVESHLTMNFRLLILVGVNSKLVLN